MELLLRNSILFIVLLVINICCDSRPGRISDHKSLVIDSAKSNVLNVDGYFIDVSDNENYVLFTKPFNLETDDYKE